MSGFAEYEHYDAMGLARLIREKQISSKSVIEAAIQRIESRNPELNAVIATLFEDARTQSQNSIIKGPLAGVPFLLKDLNTFCVGLPATNGSRAFRDFYPDKDSELVCRYRAAGLVILGKTNTPEFGMNMSTEPVLFGPTLNPHDRSRSPGGSSGGSACAVASGMLPAAHATDSGGSIRIPASNCGLFGLKPSRGRVPLGNDEPEGLAGLSTVHAMTHTVRDSAILLDIAAGSVVGDPYHSPYSPDALINAVNGNLPELRIALHTEGFAGEPVASECIEAAQTCAKYCEELGCQIEEQKPDIDGRALRQALDVLFSGNINNIVKQIKQQRQNIDDLFEPVLLDCSERGARYSAADYAAAIQFIHRSARKMGEFFTRYDLLITPTLANPPLPLGAVDMQSKDWNSFIELLLDEIPFTPLFNATGCPAASLPLGRSHKGLPIGVQIGAAFGGEADILRIAAHLERAWPWHEFDLED